MSVSRLATDAISPSGPDGEGQVAAETRQALRAAARELLTRGDGLALRGEDGGLELRAGVGQRHAARLSCTRLEHAGTALRVALEREQGGDALGEAVWSDYEGEARILAWSVANEALVRSLSKLFGNPLAATAMVPAAQERDCLWLALEHRDGAGDRAVAGWLGLGVAELHRLAAEEAWRHAPGRIAVLGDLHSLPLELRIPGPPVDARTLAELAPGDVLLVGGGAEVVARLCPDPEAAKQVFGLPESWAARARDGAWMLVEPARLEHVDESRRPYLVASGFAMDMEEVCALEPGSLLARDVMLPGSRVDVVLAGRRIAVGEVVMLGDRLGARIVHSGEEHGFQ